MNTNYNIWQIIEIALFEPLPNDFLGDDYLKEALISMFFLLYLIICLEGTHVYNNVLFSS